MKIITLLCFKNMENFLYHCIVSDEARDDEEKEFDLNMDIIEPPLAWPRATPREKIEVDQLSHRLWQFLPSHKTGTVQS